MDKDHPIATKWQRTDDAPETERDMRALLLIVYAFKQGRLPPWATSDLDVAIECAELTRSELTGYAIWALESLRMAASSTRAREFTLDLPTIMHKLFGVSNARTEAAFAAAQAGGWIKVVTS